MSGPAALEPYASLYLICVKVGLADGLTGRERAEAAWNATLRVSDRLVEATRHCEPTDVGVFELAECDPALPRVIYFSFYYSPEHYGGSPTAFGTSIYGLSRLTPPWFLHPNEVLDGAIARATMFTSTWLEANNPVLLDLYDAHGRDLAFSGVIAQRTRWTSQTDKVLTASQAVKLAARLGASGAVVTWDSGGNDFVEVATTISLCEQSGIRTILVTPDECRTGVLGATMLFLPPEADAIVTTGAVRLDHVPEPQKLIGFEEGLDQDVSVAMARPVYGQDDFYGLRKDSAFDY
jgi:glycine reductase